MPLGSMVTWHTQSITQINHHPINMQFLSALLPALLLLKPALAAGGFYPDCDITGTSGTTVTALCTLGYNGPFPETEYSTLDVNTCLSNVDGVLTYPGSGFKSTCTSISFVVNTLSAKCTDVLTGKKISTSIDLNTVIALTNGVITC